MKFLKGYWGKETLTGMELKLFFCFVFTIDTTVFDLISHSILLLLFWWKFYVGRSQKHDCECCHFVHSSLHQWHHKQGLHVWQKYQIWWWLFLHSTILCSWADSLRSHVILDEWLAFCSTFLNIHLSGVLKHWYGWCHLKLLPSWHKFCVHHLNMHHVTSCKATYIRCMGVKL